ncbi:PREDICTED: RING-H2 finger protein ATL51-like [Rhagoletis zephyria]|uniref:RING-H2 finger protein ATL51-like n=1 Tax=Rhagoletis zephyria TaxID=28612 RepID=UPI0008113F7C|nr:PREDICTED: RING-H2 finger protein ATL51-like [Rhagoletis zephyria]
MAVFRSQENIAELSAVATEGSCAICTQPLESNQECLLTSCNHVYHCNCIKTWLTNSSECPCCRQLCHLRDLQPITIHVASNGDSNNRSKNSNNNNSTRPKEKKRYHTRSQRQLNADVTQAPSKNDQAGVATNLTLPLLQLGDTPGPPTHNTRNNNQNRSNTFGRSNPNSHQNNPNCLNNVNIEQIIEASISINLNIQSTAAAARRAEPEPVIHERINVNNGNNRHFGPSQSQNFLNNPQKVTLAIQNWNVKFDGSSTGLNCE